MICVCVLFLYMCYNVFMDIMYKGRIFISFFLTSTLPFSMKIVKKL